MPNNVNPIYSFGSYHHVFIERFVVPTEEYKELLKRAWVNEMSVVEIAIEIRSLFRAEAKKRKLKLHMFG